MRDAFISLLTKHAAKNKRIYLLTGDLGFSVFEDFAARFPKRFINAGVAEANMMGVAAGLSLTGKIAVTYSIIPFSVARCLEQIRIDVAYQHADVKIVGVGAGYAYGTLGITHHGIEDIALMRAYPGMRVLSPCDGGETAACLDLALTTPGPFYIRLGKNREPRIHRQPVRARCGGSAVIRRGADVTIFVTGAIVTRVLEAAALLAEKGVRARIVSMYSLKPLDTRAVRDACRFTRAIMTVEEHGVIGGLGTAVAEALRGYGIAGIPFRKMGLPDIFCKRVGHQAELLDACGLFPGAIARHAMALCANRKHRFQGRAL